MKRFLQAASDLKLSPFRNDLSTSFKNEYLRVCRVRRLLNMAYSWEDDISDSLEDDISEEDAVYLREMLARAEVEAAEKAKRRHEQVKWSSVALAVAVAVAESAKASRRLLPPFN